MSYAPRIMLFAPRMSNTLRIMLNALRVITKALNQMKSPHLRQLWLSIGDVSLCEHRNMLAVLRVS